MGERVAWLDLTGGVSGDMLLGACLDAGADLAAVRDALAALGLPEQVELTPTPVTRAGLAAVHARVEVGSPTKHRRLADIRSLLETAALAAPVRTRALACFTALAAAEARVHGCSPEEVHFHEVGALDSIADVVGVVVALHSLAPDRLVCSPIALGGGRVATEHGPVPVPGPAVLELLAAGDVGCFGGPVDLELATPTGVALVVTLADECGPMPPMQVDTVGTGAGSRDPQGHPNVTRLVLGREPGRGRGDEAPPMLVAETNVDDLDPRLWPPTLAALLDAGAADAWLTPILMKKGRPAHTLSVLVAGTGLDGVLDVVFGHTSSIGLRITPVERVVLDRTEDTVDVWGHRVRMKVARRQGTCVNVSWEYDDVLAVADATGRAPTLVLDAARAAWHGRTGPDSRDGEQRE